MKLSIRPVDLFKTMYMDYTENFTDDLVKDLPPGQTTTERLKTQHEVFGSTEGYDWKSVAELYTRRSMWDFLFDATPLSDTVPSFRTDSFRSPQNMNRWLTSSEAYEPLKVLNTFLTKRWNKRTWDSLSPDVKDYREYLKKKWGISDEDFASRPGTSINSLGYDGKIVNRPQ
jgi:hypothetical protein